MRRIKRVSGRSPQLPTLCGSVAAMISIQDLADRLPTVVQDGEVVMLGKHSVQWFDTPTYRTPGSADF